MPLGKRSLMALDDEGRGMLCIMLIFFPEALPVYPKSLSLSKYSNIPHFCLWIFNSKMWDAQESVGVRRMVSGAQWGKGGGPMRGQKVE